MVPDVENDEDSLEDRWPTAGDRAFVTAPPAYGAWLARDGKERRWHMIRGYHRAADLLVAEAEATAYLRPKLIYPIVFCYRHSLELALKQLLEDYGHHAGHTPEFRSHQLAAIWARCREVIEHFNQGADPAPLDAIAKLIEEFADVDPGSFAFRYTSDTKGRLLDIRINWIDLSDLRAVVAGVHNFLECVDQQMSDCQSASGTSENDDYSAAE